MTDEYQTFLDAGAEVIVIAADSLENAEAYVDRHGIPFPCLVDRDHSVYDRYHVERKTLSLGQRPGLFVVDEDGVTRYSHIGRQQWEIPSNADVLDVCRAIPCKVAS